MSLAELENEMGALTILHVGDEPRDHHRPLNINEICKSKRKAEAIFLPEVLVIRNRAFVRFASPSMLRVPINDVLMVLTALN